VDPHEQMAIIERYAAGGSADDLRQAVAASRERLAMLPPYFAEHLLERLELSALLSELGFIEVDPAPMAESVELATEAVRRAGRYAAIGPDIRALAVRGLAGALKSKAVLDGDRQGLDEAVELLRPLVGTPDAGPAREALSLTLASRARLTGSAEDLEEALQLAREELAADDDAVHVAFWHARLNELLGIRFRLTGDVRDLDDALDAARIAAAGPRDNPGWMDWADELSRTLLIRYDALHDPTDLDGAIEAARQGLTASARLRNPRVRASVLTDLARALMVRHAISSDPQDIREAADAAQRAVDLLGQHAAAALRLNLALCRLWLYRTTKEPASLDEAQKEVGLALDKLRPGYPEVYRYYDALAEICREQYLASGDPSSLDAARAASERALQTAPQDAQGRAVTIGRHARLVGATNPAAAMRLWQEAATLVTAPVNDRIMAAWDWGQTGAGLDDPEEALAGYAAVVELMPTLLWRGLTRRAQEELVNRWRGAAAIAASWAIELDRSEYAVELLEFGRCLMWSQLSETRSDLTRLQAADPALAVRLEAVRAQLDPASAPLLTAGGAGDLTRLAREWDELLQQARSLPGLANFLQPVPFAEASQAAGTGAVVFVNCALRRSDALIVTPGRVEVVPLTGCSLQDIGDRALAWQQLLAGLERGRWDNDINEYLDAYRAVDEIFTFMWDRVAEPVLARLADNPRVWWIPTGPMALLPLHAAGHHLPGDSRTVLGRVVSSYTPTLRDLAQARERATANAYHSALTVAIETTKGLPPLVNSSAEVGRVMTHLPPGSATVVPETDATVRRLLDELPRHSHVHLACHGGQDPADAGSARIYLHDGPLWLRDLPALNLSSARLAYLSACRTAVGAIKLTDEAIHLAAALQLVGFPEVIATAWQISDELAPDVADLVYAELSRTGWSQDASAAHALTSALRQLRDRRPVDVLLWSSYLHVGY